MHGIYSLLYMEVAQDRLLTIENSVLSSSEPY